MPASGASVMEPRWSAAKPGEALRRRVDAQRRQRDAQAGAQLADARERLRHRAVVARAEREQRDLVAAGLVEQPVGGLDHQVDRPLAHRPVPHAGLAEAAAGGAAAHDLDDHAVVDGLEHGHDRAQHGLAGREPHEDLALGRPRAAPGHPDAGHGRERPQARLAAVLLHGRDDGAELVLRLADEEGVEERRQRPGVGDGGAAAEDDGVFPIPLGGVQRHAGQVEHLEDVRVAELVRQGEPPQVALAHRRERLERPQRDAGGAHQVGHVRPRAVGPLGESRRGVVDLAVEDLERGVGDPDLVHVRVGAARHEDAPRP